MNVRSVAVGLGCEVKKRRPGALPLDPAGAVGPRPHLLIIVGETATPEKPKPVYGLRPDHNEQPRTIKWGLGPTAPAGPGQSPGLSSPSWLAYLRFHEAEPQPYFFKDTPQMPATRRTFLAATAALMAAPVVARADTDPRMAPRVEGSATAKNVVEEWFSFTCPHCARFAEDVYPEIKTKLIDTGKLRWVFREF